MKKRFLFYLCSVLFMVSCTTEPIPVGSGRRVYKAYFQKVLTDPSSFKVYEEKHLQVGDTVYWALDVGAKNGFGAMIRNQYALMTISDYYICNMGTGQTYTKNDLKEYMWGF